MNDTQHEHIQPESQESAKRIAFALLKRWQSQMSRDEVEGIAGVALVRAAKQYDPSHGTKFESFLFYYVKAELIKAIEAAVTAKKAIEALRDAPPEYLDSNEDNSKKKKKENLLPDPDRISRAHPMTPEGQLIRDEQNAMVRAAIQRLDENHRTILELVYFQQANQEELKEALGLPRSGIKRALERAKKALEQELRATGFELQKL